MKYLYTYATIDPCIILGCTEEYGHAGAHVFEEEIAETISDPFKFHIRMKQEFPSNNGSES